jgi:hypothetical protein
MNHILNFIRLHFLLSMVLSSSVLLSLAVDILHGNFIYVSIVVDLYEYFSLVSET